MKGGRSPLGYTIIEVMIVLAVSGVMFVIAATFINGKQAKTAFNAGSNEMASRLQDVIEQVMDGRYSDIPLYCGVSASGIYFDNNLAPVEQGKNAPCVFVGKLVHFYISGTTKPEKYETFSLAQPRLAPNSSQPLTAFPNSYIVPVDQTGVVSLTTQSAVPQSLDIQRVTIVDGATGVSTAYDYNTANNIFNIGFALSTGTPNSADTSGQTYLTGGQNLLLVYAPRVSDTDGPGSGGGGANSAVTDMKTGGIKIARSATICLTDGTRYANLLIGATDTNDAGSPFTVAVRQRGTAGC